MKKVLSLLIGLCITAAAFGQTHWYSASTGNLDNLATWGANTDGTGANPASFGTATTTYHIRNRSTATIGANWVVTTASARIEVGDGLTATEFIIPSGFSLTGTGANIVTSSTGTLTIQNSTNPTALSVLDPASTVNYDRTGAQTILTGTYGNLSILNDRGGATVTFPNATVAIKGTLTVPTGVVYAMGTGTVQYNLAGGGQTILSAIPYRNLSVGLTSGTNTTDGDLSVSGTLTVATGTTFDLGTNTLSNATGITLTTSGILATQNTSATPIPSGITFGSTGTVNYNAASGGQTVVAGTYSGLKLGNTSGTSTAAGNISVTTLTTTAGGTLDMGTNSITGTLTTITNNGTIKTQAPTAAFTSGKNFTVATGIVEYNGTGAQTIVGGTYAGTLLISGARGANDITFEAATVTVNNLSLTATGVSNYVTTGNTIAYSTAAGGKTIYSVIPYNNLTLSNTSGTNTADGNISIANNLTTTSGGTFDLSTFDITGAFAGTLTNNGTIKTSSLTNPALPSGKSWTGTTGGVTFASLTGGQSIPTGTYKVFTCLNTSGTNTVVGGDLSVSSTFTATGGAGGTLDLGTNALIGAALTPAGAGTIKTQNTTATPLPTGRTWTGTVNYNAATGGQTVMAGTYATLTLGNTSGTSTASGALTVNTALNTTTGGTLDMTTFAMAGTLTTITNNGLITTDNVSATPFTSGKTFGGTGTVRYNAATGGQTIMLATYNNITLMNSSGTNTASGDITVNGLLTTTAGGTFDFANVGFNLLAGGSMTVSHSGILQTTCTVSPAIPAGKSWGGTVIYARTTGGQPVAGGTFNALTVQNTSGTNTAAADIVVNGTLTTTAGGTLSMSTFQLSGTTTPSNDGTITTACTVNPAIPAGKDWTGAAAGAVTFNAASGAQFIPAGTFRTLTCSNTTGTNTVTGTVAVSTAFQATGAAAANIDFGTNLLTGAFTYSGAGTLKTQNTSATPLPTGKTWTGTINYNAATGAQTIMPGTYTSLASGNTSGTNTVTGGDIAVSGTLTNTAGGTMDMGTNLITGAFTPAGTGILATQNLTAAPVPTGKTWTGNVKYNALTGGQTVMAGTYATLTLGNTSGTSTASGALSVSAALTTTSGGTLDMGANAISGTLTTITNDGTVTTANTTATPFTVGKTWGGSGTVIYNVATGGQTVVTGTYNNLTLLNSSNTNTAGGAMTVNGTLTTTAGGTFDFNAVASQLLGASMTAATSGILQTTCTVAPAIPAGKNWGGTVIFSRLTGGQTIASGTFNALTFGNTSLTNTATGDLTVNGALTTTSGGTVAMGTNQLLGTVTPTNNGTITTTCTANPAIPSGKTWTGTTGNVTFAATTGAQFIPAGTYKVLACSNTSGTNTVTGTIDVSTTFTSTGGASGSTDLGTNLLTGTFTPAGLGTLFTQNTTSAPVPTGKTWTGTVNYNAASGAQTIMSGTYATLTLGNTSGTQTAEGALTVNTALNNTNSGSTLDMSTFAMAGTLTTITNNGTITTANTSAAPFTTGKTYGGTGTIIYNLLTGGQTVMAGTYTNNLTLSNTSGTNTASGVLTVNGNLTTTAGGTLNMVTFALAGSGTPSNSGTIRTQSVTNPALPSNKTWGGTVTYDATTGAQFIPLGTYNNLTLSNTSGTETAVGALTVNTALTTTSAGTLAMGTNQLLGAFAITNNGTITTTCTANPPIPTGKTWTGTTGGVTFAATTGAQFIPAGNYKTLTCSNTSGVNTVTGTIDVSGGTFTHSGGASGSTDLGTNQLTGTFTPAGAGTLLTQNTSSTPVPTGKTWTGTINYNAATGGQTVMAGTYATLTLGNTSGTSSPSGALTVNTALNLTNSGATLDMLTTAMAGTLTTITNNGTITTSNTSAAPFTAGKVFGGTGTVVYAVTTGGQTIAQETYNSLTLSNSSGTNSAGGAIVVNNGTLTTTAGGTFDMVTFGLSGTATIAHSGTLLTQSVTNPAIPSGKTWGGTVNYNRAAGGQTLPAGTYNNLLINNTAGNTGVAGDITVNGTFTTASGGTTVMGNNQLLGTISSLTHNGTITTTCTVNPALPSGKDWSTGTTAVVTFANAAGGQFIPGGTYKTVNCNNASSTNTAVGNITVTGTITTSAASGILNMGTFDLAAGTMTNNASGTVRTQSTSSTPLPANKALVGTITYDAAAGGQTIVTETSYTNLTISNTSGTNTANGNIVVNGVFTTGSGTAVVDFGSNTLSGTFSTPAGGGTIKTANTTAAPIKTGLTWPQTIEYNNATGGQTIVNGTYNGGLTNSNTSGTNTLAASFAVNGTLTLSSGSVLADGNFTLSLTGNLAGTGTHNTSASGKITMLQNGATISGATLGNLTLNASSGNFSLAGDATVNGTLTFTAGTLTIGTNNLSLGTSAPAISGASSSNFIIASNTGEVRKKYSGTGAYTFPIGDATPNYTPATVNVTGGTPGGSAYIGVNVKNTKHPNNNNTTNYLNRYWSVSASGFTSPVYSMTGTYIAPGDVVGTEASISSARWSGSTPWTKYSAVNTGSHFISATALTNTAADYSGINGAVPTVTVTPTSAAICSGNSQNLDATGGGDPTLTYTWAPATGLSATTGASVVASPTTGTVATTYNYTVTITDGNGFTNTATTTLTVNPTPPAITGTASVCEGANTTLSNTLAGGNWSSATPAVGTIDPSTGIFHGIDQGTTVVSYTMGTGCYAVTTVTVNNQPAAITGTLSVCEGATTALGNGDAGGDWTSSTPAVGTIGLASGIAAGISAGTTSITYTLSGGCYTTSDLTVNATPAAIGGTASVCEGANTTLTNATPSGNWSSATPAVGTIDASTGVFHGIDQGTTVVSYTVGSGCYSVKTVTVNNQPGAITGTLSVCQGLTTALGNADAGGDWTSATPAVGTIDISTGVATGITAGNTNITYTLPGGCYSSAGLTVNPTPTINGILYICNTFTNTLTATPTGGTWSSSDDLTASVGSSTGAVTGEAAGNAYITYTTTDGCINTVQVTVAAALANITGASGQCEGFTTTLSHAIAGGTWSSSNPSRATVDANTGVVAAISAGPVVITYTLPSGCYKTKNFDVQIQPVPITGVLSMCEGSNTVLYSIIGGSGTWSSSNAAVATPADLYSGSINSVAQGTATITYKIPTSGCFVVAEVTVNPTPTAITGGGLQVCAGSTQTLSSTPSGGTWTSSNTSVATIGSSSGDALGGTGGTTNISYTMPTGCRRIDVLTVNNLPAAITGTLLICPAGTSTLSDPTGGGVWSSSTPAVGTISAGGVVTPIGLGNTTITYTLGTGCLRTTQVTVTAAPPAIAGTALLCVGGSTTLSNASAGGTWASSTPAKATVVFNTGVVTGVATGTSTITYTVSGAGCYTSKDVTINAAPSAITGTANACVGFTSTLGHAIPGGTWTSSNTSVATVGSSSGVVTAVAAGNATITYYTTPTCPTTVAFTSKALPAAITGNLYACVGTTTVLGDATSGGTWTSSNTGVATIHSTNGTLTGTGVGNSTITYTLPTGCYAVAEATVNAAPSAITGPASVCNGSVTTLNCTPASGTWASSNLSIGTIDATTGEVNGIAPGTTTITYTQAVTGCRSTKTFTVGAAPAAITGNLTLCVSSTSTLADATSGGTWSSSSPTNASVGSTTGLVTALVAGNTTISYNHSGGCVATAVVTVTSAVSGITGNGNLCVGGTTTLNDADGGGTWISSVTAKATVGSTTGIVTGVAAGTSTITYKVTASCFSTMIVTVAAAPAAITGTTNVCVNASITLSHATPGGTWTSSNPAIGSVDATTGVVTGITAGTISVTYTVSNGCFAAKTINVNALPPAISGTMSICEAAGSTLTCIVGGSATWSSSNTAVATIGSTSGLMTGVAAGNATITYKVNSTGCISTREATINALPDVIVGSSTICVGSLQNYSSTTVGGTWTSSAPTVASIGSATGDANGLTGGSTTISYTIANGCRRTKLVTVNNLPAAITGTTTLCMGGTSTLASTTTGGAWTSDNVSASISGVGVVTPTGVGTSLISYTLGTGCARTATVTVNAALPANTGNNTICVGGTTTLANATPGGTWASSVTAKATVGVSTGVVTGVAAGTSNISYATTGAGCYSITQVTVNAAPAAITGTTNACVNASTTLSHVTPGGTWSSSNTGLATVGTDGVVTGVAAGAPMISYMVSPGCVTSIAVTIKALPTAITGSGTVCVGSTTTLGSTPSGGTWASSNTGVAIINTLSGVVTGSTAGTSTITYKGTNGCIRTTDETVNPLPAAISGTLTCSVTATSALTDATTGGTWSSSNTAKATIGSSDGIVTGVATGTTIITYTAPTGCIKTATFTVTASRPGGYVYFSSSDRKIIFSVFPNPTNGTFTIEAPAKGIFSIYAIDGKKIIDYEVNAETTTVTLPKDLAAGAYMCRFNQEDGEATIVRLWYQP